LVKSPADCFGATVFTLPVLSNEELVVVLALYSLNLDCDHVVAVWRTVCCSAQGGGAGVGGAVDGAVLSAVLEMVGCVGYPRDGGGGAWYEQVSGSTSGSSRAKVELFDWGIYICYT
jgi:hypothetical protein